MHVPALLTSTVARTRRRRRLPLVEVEETYAERVAKREAEIEALQQAMEILEN